MLKKLFSPRAIFSFILGALLLAALLAFGDVKKAFALMSAFQPIYLLYFLLIMTIYETLRCGLWHFLLKSLNIHVPLGEQVFTFFIGEVTKVLPIGNYVPDYLLQRFEGTDFGLASAATTLIVLIEVGISLVGLVVLGINGWDWLRPLIVIGVAVFTLLIWAFLRWRHALHAPHWFMRLTQHDALRQALDEVRQFVAGGETLLHPRVLLPAAGVGALYLVAGGGMLYMVVRGLGIEHITYGQTLAVYLFSLAFSLIVPIPIDIGVTEASGTGVFLVMGVSRSAAVSVMLLNRVLSIAASVVIAILIAITLRQELRAALRKRPQPQSLTRPQR